MPAVMSMKREKVGGKGRAPLMERAGGSALGSLEMKMWSFLIWSRHWIHDT